MTSLFCTDIYTCCFAKQKRLKSLSSQTDFHQYIKVIPGHTSYQQTSASCCPSIRSISTNLEQIIIYYQLPPDGSMNWSTNRCHCSLGNFNNQSGWPTGRVTDTIPMGSIITHRDSTYSSNPLVISWSSMESLKPTPRVVLRLGGYMDMAQ